VQDLRTRARDALRALYAEVAADLAARPGLRCELSGRCCRFREAGHALYLTRLELDEMRAHGGDPAPDAERCPWLRNGLCANRDGRALACRTYFCSDEAQAAEVTERWHAGIRRIHDAFRIPYEYGALADLMER
jgi:hypothetical protein